MLEASQQEVQILEESSDLQRETYLIEIENLRRHIDILTQENKQLIEK
jgi:hypothetical protein